MSETASLCITNVIVDIGVMHLLAKEITMLMRVLEVAIDSVVEEEVGIMARLDGVLQTNARTVGRAAHRSMGDNTVHRYARQ